MSNFNKIPHFMFWCQKVLPLVYDNSLSYYELLNKVVYYLNHVIEDINAIPDYIKQIIDEEHLEQYVDEIFAEIRKQIARADEGSNETASVDRTTGELVWLKDDLVRMTRDILAGDRYIEDTGEVGVTGNYVKTSVEMEINRLRDSINNTIGSLDNLTTTTKTNLVSAINEVLETLTSTTGNLDDLITTAKTDLVSAINEVVGDIASSVETIEGEITDVENSIGTLSELTTEDKSTIVNAINELVTDLGNLDVNHVYNQSTPTSGLTTNIGLKEGTYDITEDTTINAQLVVPKGAIINIASGVTLTIAGDILAGRYQIFDGMGSVVCTKQKVGYPEWFGAQPRNSSYDSLPAIQKCINTFCVTELNELAYYVSDTIVINAPNKVLRGISRDNVGHYTDRSCMLVYPATFSGVGIQIGSIDNEIANRPFGIGLRNLTVTNYLSNSGASTSKGVTVATVQSCTIENVNIRAFHIGLEVINASYSLFKSVITSGPENDEYYIGINIPANPDIEYTGIGTNSTVYFEHCAINGWDGHECRGFNFDKGYGLADTFVTQLECYGCKYGVYADFAAANATQRNQNIYFHNCLFDYSEFAFYLKHDAGANPYRPAISIVDPYIEMRTGSSNAWGFAFNYGMTSSYGGLTSITGGIVTGSPKNSAAFGTGIGGYGVNGLIVKGTLFREISRLIDMSTDTDVNPNNVIDCQICNMSVSNYSGIIKTSASNCKFNLSYVSWGGQGQLFHNSCNFKNCGIDVTACIASNFANGFFGAAPATLSFTDVFTKNAGGNWYIG